MAEIKTWRELLGTIIENKHERQRLADILDVAPITLVRWATRQASPRMPMLQQLIAAIPGHAEVLRSSMQAEFPDMVVTIPAIGVENTTISTHFYRTVLDVMIKSSTDLRFWSMSKLILQQASKHIDPEQVGIIMAILRCVPPIQGNTVRSLSMSLGQITLPTMSIWDSWPVLAGVETLPGVAVSNGHIMTIPNLQLHTHYPLPGLEQVRSATALPIRRAHTIAGCLYVCSMQPDYFLPWRLHLLQSYIDLLTLAFDEVDFYPQKDIHLGLLPSLAIQATHSMHFQQYIVNTLIEAMRNGQSMTHQQAELQAWHLLEEKLFAMSAANHESSQTFSKVL